MNFICIPCRVAADGKIPLGGPKRGHEQCRGGTWCDCQHRLMETK